MGEEADAPSVRQHIAKLIQTESRNLHANVNLHSRLKLIYSKADCPALQLKHLKYRLIQI
jgi:hypothetical protein